MTKIKIFVDFEMHPISRNRKDARKISSNEIIEFGAVMLDEHNQEIDRFISMVKPFYAGNYDPMVLSMTHIRPEQISKASGFCSVFREFVKWCEQTGEEYTIYSWSDIDRVICEKEVKLKQYRENDSTRYMFSHWEDYQKIFTRMVGAGSVISLANAGKAANIKKSGKAHDALVDALDTAEVYRFVESGADLTPLYKEFKDILQSRTTALHAAQYEYALENRHGGLISFNVYKNPHDKSEKIIRVPLYATGEGVVLVATTNSEDYEVIRPFTPNKKYEDEEYLYMHVTDEKKAADE